MVPVCYQVCCQLLYCVHRPASRSKLQQSLQFQADMVLSFRKPMQWKPFSQSWRPSKLKCSRLVFLSVKSARQPSMRLCSALNASSTEPCGLPTSAHFLRMSLAKGPFLFPEAFKGRSWGMPQGSSLTQFQSTAHGYERIAIGKCETICESTWGWLSLNSEDMFKALWQRWCLNMPCSMSVNNDFIIDLVDCSTQASVTSVLLENCLIVRQQSVCLQPGSVLNMSVTKLHATRACVMPS